ncbi:MAG: hypothetical protein AAB470_01155 [Patescibacteria group bacterium]
MKTTYYIEPRDSNTNQRIAELLSQQACESEAAERRCADKLSRNLWAIPGNLFPFILGSSGLNISIFKDEGSGIIFFNAVDFVTTSSDITFDDPIARKNFILKILSQSKWLDLLSQLERFTESFLKPSRYTIERHNRKRSSVIKMKTHQPKKKKK